MGTRRAVVRALREAARGRSLAIALLLLAAAVLHSGAVFAAEPHAKSVLLIYPHEQEMASYLSLDRALRSTLQAGSPYDIEYYSEYLDLLRFSEEQRLVGLVEYLHVKYSGRRIDLIVVISSLTFEFLLNKGEELFPGVPILFTSVNVDVGTQPRAAIQHHRRRRAAQLRRQRRRDPQAPAGHDGDCRPGRRVGPRKGVGFRGEVGVRAVRESCRDHLPGGPAHVRAPCAPEEAAAPQRRPVLPAVLLRRGRAVLPPRGSAPPDMRSRERPRVWHQRRSPRPGHRRRRAVRPLRVGRCGSSNGRTHPQR